VGFTPEDLWNVSKAIKKGGWVLNESRRHKVRYIKIFCNGTEMARQFILKKWQNELIQGKKIHDAIFTQIRLLYLRPKPQT